MTQYNRTINIGTNKLSLVSQKDTHIIKVTNIKGQIFYRGFSIYQDIPYSAQKFLPTLQDFIKVLQNLMSQKNPSDYVVIDSNLFISLKLKISIGKFQLYHQIRIDLIPQNNQIDILTKKINQMEKRLAEFMGQAQKNKLKEKEQKKDILDIEILSKKKQKQDKKAEKEKQKQKPNNKEMKKPDLKEVPKIKPFKIEDKKVTITESSNQIEASLISKQGINLISVSVHVMKNKLTYVGQLNDHQIQEFLSSPTRIKNSIELFQQIKRNAAKEIAQTMKVNQKQNKLEILIHIPSSKDKLIPSSTDTVETIFAQIDIKPIKQQHREEKQTQQSITPKSNKKSLESSRDFDAKSTRSYSQPMTKQSLIKNVKQSLLNQSKGKKKDVNHSSFDQISTTSTTGRNRKSNPKVDDDKTSEISFKTKNTVQKLKQAKEVKEVKSRKKNKTSDNSDGDFSLSFSYPARPKSKK